nr:MAG TPA: hypothetical protein [Caudoviricetes sp.]
MKTSAPTPRTRRNTTCSSRASTSPSKSLSNWP